MFIFIIFYCFLWKMFILHSLDNIIWIIIRYLNRFFYIFFKYFFLEFEKTRKKIRFFLQFFSNFNIFKKPFLILIF